MKCPECESSHGSTVVGTRYRACIGMTVRRRECLNPDCSERFTTYEVIAGEKDLKISRSIGMSILHGKDCGKWTLKYLS